jgi:hypothetical protein
MIGKVSVSVQRDLWDILSRTAGLGDLIQSRGHVSCRHPTKVAGLALVERPAPVHRATIILDHKIALSPDMAVNETTLGGEFDQVANQQTAFGNGSADDM